MKQLWADIKNYRYDPFLTEAGTGHAMGCPRWCPQRIYNAWIWLNAIMFVLEGDDNGFTTY